MREGEGCFRWPNGDIYSGNFENNIINGVGKQKWLNPGNIYFG